MPEWAAHVRARLASLRLSPTRETEIVTSSRSIWKTATGS